MDQDEEDVLEDLSYSFYADGKTNTYIDNENNTVNNYKTKHPSSLSSHPSSFSETNPSTLSKTNPSTLSKTNLPQNIPKTPSMEDLLISATPPDPINHLTRRTREKWVEDGAVTKCQKCQNTFRIYRRRHHCYNCGLVFCDVCTSYRSKIPKVVKKIPTRTGAEEPINYNVNVRLCLSCFNNYETIHKLEKLLTVFSLMDLTIFDFKNLSLVCKAWRPMALFYLSKFREIQYKLPKYSYNSWEKQALWSNRIILKNHAIWQVHVLRSVTSERFKDVVDLYFSSGVLNGSSANVSSSELNNSDDLNSLEMSDINISNLKNQINQVSKKKRKKKRKVKSLNSSINKTVQKEGNELNRSINEEKEKKKEKKEIYGEAHACASQVPTQNLKNIPKNSKECWDRMCSRYCKKKMDPERALLLLDLLDKKDETVICIDDLGKLEKDLNSLDLNFQDLKFQDLKFQDLKFQDLKFQDLKFQDLKFQDLNFQKNIIAREITVAFEVCDDYILECYLPYILFKMVSSNNGVLKNWIFLRCVRSIRIANCTYWFLKTNSKIHFAELCEKLPQTTLASLLKSESFLELIKDGKDIKDTIISPVTPELGEQTVKSEGISIKTSATKPTFIPCDKSSILFKKDDIRRDQVIICVIRLMEKILQDSGLDISIITYNVQPTSKEEGFIQIVENCETLYGISEKLNTSIINYLMKYNPDEPVNKLRTRFKNSCAIYSVIAFLLSISDRNTENLMLTQDGQFFEIDFGFILSLDPKILRTSCVRITPQMLEALGGDKSKEYEEFKELCGTVYDILRRHVNTFVCLLSIIPTFKSSSKTSPDIDETQMYLEIIKRFCPGETYEDAIRNLKTRIDDSSHNSTFSKYHVIDFFHKHNREATVGNFLGGTLTTAYNLMGGIYSYLF